MASEGDGRGKGGADLMFLVGEVPEGVAGEVMGFLMGARRVFSSGVLREALVQSGTVFQRAVWGEIARIPWGEVRCYGEIAVAVGRPGAVRAVGTACGRNKYPLVVPCHRVVGARGIGGYGYGVEVKEELLRRERSDDGSLGKVYGAVSKDNPWKEQDGFQG